MRKYIRESSVSGNRRWLLTVGLMLIATAAGWACQDQPAPTAPAAETESAQAVDDKKPKRPPIYDETAEAADQIQTALAKASRENRRVLIVWGGNWCGWCYRLHDIFQSDQEIARTLMYEYDVVLVDIGQMDKNQELLAKYDADLKKHGVPFLTILDGDGNVAVNQETSSLEKDDMENPGHDHEAVLAFLKEHQASPLKAGDVLAAAIERGRAENKLVFLHFGAPWCGWCHRLEAWLAKPEIESLMSPVFVDLKVDTDRMEGGQAMLDEYCKEPSGIPWFVFLDPQTGSVVAHSTGPKGNVGFPFEDFEIDHFVDMLKQCGTRFGATQIETIRQSLVDNREAIKARPAQSAARASGESNQ